MTRGIKVDFITFLTPRTKSDDLMIKLNLLSKRVSKFSSSNTRYYVVNFKKVQEHIKDNLRYEEYRTLFLRRAFLMFSDQIAQKYYYDMLITGDSLGQVSSQTIKNIQAIDNATTLLVGRPLLGRNKNDIISLAKKIGTYQYSIMKGDDMCTMFTPKKPILNPKLEKVLDIKEQIEDYKNLFNKIIEEDIEIEEIENA
jgi:thiamine biosynthesis protein ThiI